MARFDLTTLEALVATWTPDDHVELGGIEETDSAYRLGHVVLHRHEPFWMVGDDVGELMDMCHLRMLEFDLPRVALSGVAAIFHVDGEGSEPTSHDERFCGWVRADRKAELHRSLAWLNGHIHELIVDAKGHENAEGELPDPT